MSGKAGRAGAVRKPGTKNGPPVGSGGHRRRGLEGKGPTPPAHLRPYHPAARRVAQQKKVPQRVSNTIDTKEIILGRNPVLECLRVHVPAHTLYIALGTVADKRLTEIVARATQQSLTIIELPRIDLDRLTTNGLHQGVALQVNPYQYYHPDDLLRNAMQHDPAGLLVALDNISDPRNLGAIIRSSSAFGAHGVVIPQRRSVAVTAVAWRTSAGAVAKIPIGRAANLNQTLSRWAQAGLSVIGLDAQGATPLDQVDFCQPLVIVVGSEGKGLSRLVRQHCDVIASIPMVGQAESLNAAVAAGIALAEVVRQRHYNVERDL